MNGRKGLRLFYAALIASLLSPCVSPAQTNQQSEPSSPEQSVGLTAFEAFEGSYSKLGLVTTLDTDVGYNLGEHFGGDIGLPFYTVRSPFSLVTTHIYAWTTLFADPYVDIRYRRTVRWVKFTSVLTGTIPVKNELQIYSTGRFGGDWFNHIESASPFKGEISPFINFGISNGTGNRYYMPRPYSSGRPYQTLGLMADGEAGASLRIPFFKILKGYEVGASAYALEPRGNQKVFSRLVAPNTAVVGSGAHNRYFNSAFETTGGTAIDRDNGYSAWVEATRFKNLDVQVGYTRSVHYAYDTYSVTLRFDGTSFIRMITGLQR